MKNLIDRNRKKILAIFSAGLMIAFFLPTGRGPAGRGGQPVVAHIGDTPVYYHERANATSDWNLLKTQLVQFGGQAAPIVYRLGPGIVDEINERPELYFLLQREAVRSGVRVTAEQVNPIVQQMIRVRRAPDRDPLERLRQAATGLALVENLLEQVGGEVKISEPEVQHALAVDGQRVALNLVEFPVARFEGKLPAPTTREVQEQFNRFATVAPLSRENDPTTNPFLFGYRYPNRVKLQYLTVPFEPVMQSVKRTQTDFQWEVLANQYYLEHSRNYTTQPSTTQASTAPTTGVSTRSAQLAGPTTSGAPLGGPTTQEEQAATRPVQLTYAQAHDRVLRDVMRPLAAAKATEIAAKIAERLVTDWHSLSTRPAPATTQSPAAPGTTAPATAETAAFGTPQYLQRLAADIGAQTGITPETHSLTSHWLDARELTELAGISRSSTGSAGFLNYLMESLQPFATKSKADSEPLKLMQPSLPLHDDDGNIYFFQVVEAQVSQPPNGVVEVEPQVREDLQKNKAYQLARDTAQKLLETARKQGLAAAAQASGERIITTGLFGPLNPEYLQRRALLDPIPGYEIAGPARQRLMFFARQQLLAAATPANPHPLTLMELPVEGKVIVAELSIVQPIWSQELQDFETYMVARQLQRQEQIALLYNYFKFDATAARLSYRSAEPAHR